MTDIPRSGNKRISHFDSATIKNIRIRSIVEHIERTFLPVGSEIGKYRIIDEIDRGGMAVVYKALQLDLDRQVALKVMPANVSINHKFMERFLSEAHAVARLSHTNIVTIYEVSMESNIYYLAMEYIPGKNLFYHLHFHKPKLIEVLEIVSRLADALNYAHSQKIIHRDLKLNNVIMKDRLTPILIDFGLAKAMEDDEAGITRTGELMGSPSYMAPERLMGGVVDHRSDICSLGIMLYEMLTFKNPYLDQRNLHQTTINVMEANPIPLRKLIPWLPVEIEAITLKAMAKNIDQRYQSMEEFKADINRYQRGEPILAQPPSMWSKIRRYFKRHWAVLIIISLILLFSGVIAFISYTQLQKGKSHWQVVYNNRFSSKDEDWVFNSSDTSNSTQWVINDGVFHSPLKPGHYFTRLKKRFNRDILIEFDLHAVDSTLFNAGFFLYGTDPNNAYCFHLNRTGNAEYGITFPGSNLIFQDQEPLHIPIGRSNHIVIERIQNSLTFSINDKTITRVFDYMPPLGLTHENIGFFTNGSPITIDNLKVSRRAIPQQPNPTLIADRFFERGDFETALEEYRGLSIDYGSIEGAREISVKSADCLIRMKRYQEAIDILNNSFNLKTRDETVAAQTLFLLALSLNQIGQNELADQYIERLAQNYPSSPVNQSAMTSALIRIDKHLKEKNSFLALREINALSHMYRHARSWGQIQLQTACYYTDIQQLDSALIILNRILDTYSRNQRVVSLTRTELGRLYLHKGDKVKAMDLFNQSVSSHVSNDAVWEAWMELAGIYEFDFSYKDAVTIYQKIYRECPKNVPYPWIARLKIGELAMRDSTIANATEIFKDVAKYSFPFPLPSTLARFYLDDIDEGQFKEFWDEFYPNDRFYLYYFALKAIFNSELVVARLYLQDLKRTIPHQSWRYYQVYKILNKLEERK